MHKITWFASIFLSYIAAISVLACSPPLHSAKEPAEETHAEDAGSKEKNREGRTGVLLLKIEGDGAKNALVLPPGFLLPPKPIRGRQRFQTSLWLYGKGLDKIERVKLESMNRNSSGCGGSRRPCTFYPKDGVILGPMQTEKDLQRRKLRLPALIFSGLFSIIATVNGSQQALAQVYLLQGEKGDKGDEGKQGPQGPNGKAGKPCSLKVVK